MINKEKQGIKLKLKEQNKGNKVKSKKKDMKKNRWKKKWRINKIKGGKENSLIKEKKKDNK